MKRLPALFLIALAAVAQTTPTKAPAAAAPATPARQPGLYAIFNTSKGTITAKLFENETPVTVKNFVALARGAKQWMDPNTKAMVTKSIYNNITFHRVIKNFMVQTGDPTATGSHDCGFTIKDEFVPSLQFDQPFLLGMANIGAPNSGACQFFITVVPTPWLNNKHTIFGKVVEGQDIVTQIDNAPTGPGDKPNPAIKLISVTIKREGPPPAGAATTSPAKKATTTAPKTTAPVKKP